MMNKKILAGLLTTSAIVTFTLGVVSGETIQNQIKKITASINYQMKIKLNGNDLKVMDVDKKTELKPIIYNGRTYVPLRGLSEAYNVAVDYDSATSTIILGEREGKGISISRLNPKFDSYGNNGALGLTQDSDILAVDGKTYSEGVYFTELTDNSYYAATMEVNTGRKYQTVSFEASVTNGEACTIQIYSKDPRTGLLVKQANVIKADGAKLIEADIGAVETLYIRAFGDKRENSTKVVLGEVYFK